MKTFIPSKKILEAICWDSKAHRQYTTFPAETNELGLVSYLGHVMVQIEQFYRHQFKTELEKENKHKIGIVIWEALQNSWVHGSKEGTNFTHGLFMAKRGLCNGFEDRSGYFKKQEIKMLYENKTEVKEFDTTVEGHRVGVNKFIFPNTDMIEVDNRRGILYCVQIIQKNQKINI